MRVVVQRVSYAGISISREPHSSIKKGLLLLAGIAREDDEKDIEWICRKVTGMRLFDDENGKMNLNVSDIDGEILLVSQFTLFASLQKGNRPSFTQSSPPLTAKPVYDALLERLSHLLPDRCSSGVFGENMQISLVNDGPVTIVLDSRNKE